MKNYGPIPSTANPALVAMWILAGDDRYVFENAWVRNMLKVALWMEQQVDKDTGDGEDQETDRS